MWKSSCPVMCLTSSAASSRACCDSLPASRSREARSRCWSSLPTPQGAVTVGAVFYSLQCLFVCLLVCLFVCLFVGV